MNTEHFASIDPRHYAVPRLLTCYVVNCKSFRDAIDSCACAKESFCDSVRHVRLMRGATLRRIQRHALAVFDRAKPLCTSLVELMVDLCEVTDKHVRDALDAVLGEQHVVFRTTSETWYSASVALGAGRERMALLSECDRHAAFEPLRRERFAMTRAFMHQLHEQSAQTRCMQLIALTTYSERLLQYCCALYAADGNSIALHVRRHQKVLAQAAQDALVIVLGCYQDTHTAPPAANDERAACEASAH